MKKKLLPYILGCSLAAVLPFAAHAEDTSGTYFHTGHDIETSGSTVDYADWNASSQTKPDVADSDGHNEFTEYNSSVDETTGTQNKRSQTFGTPSIVNNVVNWTASGLGNTRNTTAYSQHETTGYPIGLMNEQADYRSDPSDPSTLAEDLAEAASQDNHFNIQDNDTPGTTDLETSISEYIMTIPAKTVLPMGATHWRLGNVKINGKYFLRPNKVDVVVTHLDFKHSLYDDAGTQEDKDARTIVFTVSDRRYTDADLDSNDHRYFFQNGTSAQTSFPYAYTAYDYTNYRNGLISDINETHQVWLNAAADQWSGKVAGKYTGSITFSAAVTQADTDVDQHMYDTGYTYPAEGDEPVPQP